MFSGFCLKKKHHRYWQGSVSFVVDRTHLLDGVLALEQYPPGDELGKYTTDAPHVYGGGVVFGAHQYFRRSVILSHHFLCHVLGLVRFFHSGETEIAYLYERTRKKTTTTTVKYSDPHSREKRISKAIIHPSCSYQISSS